MRSRTIAGSLALALLLVRAPAAAAADDVTLLRVFLKDGTALVSYGEPARVDDRVVFSMPTAATADPPLHLVNLDAARVDWVRTNRYAEAARAARYIQTQAASDYAALSGRVTQALNQLTETEDAGRRLVIAENARRMLATWPQAHYNYRLTEVRQMLSLLDEAIADLRAAAEPGKFDLSLTAFTEPPALEPLIPPPTPKETIEQVLIAARLADTATERRGLLETALTALDRDQAALPAEWLAATRTATRARFETERRVDRAYQSLTARIISLADRQAKAADVGSLARLADSVRLGDRALGGQRPETVASLIAAVEARLDAARRLQLSRDRWALRAPEFRQYRRAIQAPLDRLTTLEPLLQQIKLLAGSSPSSLTRIERAVSQILEQARTISPPEEFRGTHALLVSAVQLAGNAGRIRREATLAEDIARAWDASSAAAGALMLAARARTDMQSLLRPPQLR
jgi:hypothetical protein